MPLLVRRPARIKAGSVSNGIQEPAERLRKSDKVYIDGVNNLAHWTSGAPSARNVYYHYNENDLTAIRIGPWKSHLQIREGFFDYLRPSALLFNLRMDPFEQHGGQKADDMAMRLGVAWGGQVQDAVRALTQSLVCRARRVLQRRAVCPAGPGAGTCGRRRGGSVRQQAA